MQDDTLQAAMDGRSMSKQYSPDVAILDIKVDVQEIDELFARPLINSNNVAVPNNGGQRHPHRTFRTLAIGQAAV
jgi:hypothetical protein